MSRQQRRQAERRGEVFEMRTEIVTPERARQFLSKSGCGWRGCSAICDSTNKPAGWVNLIVYAGACELDLRRIGDRWRHDKILCPTHAKALDQLLPPMPAPELAGPAQGSA